MIAFITVPIVLNIIEKARRGVGIASARSYIKTTKTYVLTGQLNKNTLEKNNKYNIIKEKNNRKKTYQKVNDLVEIKGIKPNGIEEIDNTLQLTATVTKAKRIL